jgi:hypothetical protein
MGSTNDTPRKWVYIKGKWHKQAGLVTDQYLLNQALMQHKDVGSMQLRPSTWLSRAWWYCTFLPVHRLNQRYSTLTTDQRIATWSVIVSGVLSLLALIVSIVALIRSGD